MFKNRKLNGIGGRNLNNGFKDTLDSEINEDIFDSEVYKNTLKSEVIKDTLGSKIHKDTFNLMDFLMSIIAAIILFGLIFGWYLNKISQTSSSYNTVSIKYDNTCNNVKVEDLIKDKIITIKEEINELLFLNIVEDRRDIYLNNKDMKYLVTRKNPNGKNSNNPILLDFVEYENYKFYRFNTNCDNLKKKDMLDNFLLSNKDTNLDNLLFVNNIKYPFQCDIYKKY